MEDIGDVEKLGQVTSPIAGLGCGLPLSRLHARYLGGKIDLHSLPNHGVDVFVYLNRMGNSVEADDVQFDQGSFALSRPGVSPSWEVPTSGDNQYSI